MENLVNCSKCNKEVKITIPGNSVDILECGHALMKTSVSTAIKSGAASGVDAVTISNALTQVKELPKINGNELVSRALSTVNQHYEEFFNAENPIIEDIIKEHGKDNAVLVFTAIHAHLSKVLFAVNRFRNVYYVRIEALRKEVEDKAVKDLISNHDFHYENVAPKPKKIGKVGKTGTDVDKAKVSLGALTKADGTPIDITGFMSKLMFNKKAIDKKHEYQDGLDKIADSITSKESK